MRFCRSKHIVADSLACFQQDEPDLLPKNLPFLLPAKQHAEAE
jgi:hypothetical protein